MRNLIKRVFRLRLLLMLLGLFVIIIFSQTSSVSAEEQKKYPYLIKVNRVFNTITVYEQDEAGNYTKPLKAMLCSVGATGQTKVGTYQTKAKYRWKLLMGDVWGQYSTRIVDGILFHSVYYYKECDPSTLATKQFNKLGTAASHGCVRLSVADAKWIYDNCAVGTTVVIYDGKKSPGPLGKPDAIKIASNVRWDPTDPNIKNPYLKSMPVITGVKDRKVAWGTKYNLLSGIKATSSVGANITSKISSTGKVDTYSPGKYKVTYYVTDALGITAEKSAYITVEKNKIIPVFKGIIDRAVGSEEDINEQFVLAGVKAYCSDKQLDNASIKVTIKKQNDAEYDIIYKASVGNGPVATANSKVFIDIEAPIFTGIADKTVEAEKIPDETFAMEGVSVSDNLSAAADIKIRVTVEENEDGNYLASYIAEDKAGNMAIEYAIIYKKN